MPASIRVAVVASASIAVLGVIGFAAGAVEDILLVGMAFWIARGSLGRDARIQDQAFGFGLIGALTFGATALVSLATALIARRSDLWGSIPRGVLICAPFAALAFSLSRRSANGWFRVASAAPALARGPSPSAQRRWLKRIEEVVTGRASE